MQQSSGFTTPGVLIAMLMVAILPIGLFILLRGLRGRTIDDHPICRKCGFDLFGLPQGVEKCSECGAVLTQPHAIRIGHRRRRPAMVWVGGFLFMIGLAVAALIGLSVAQDVNWIEHEPTWYVFRQSQVSNVPADQTAALQELARRVGAGELSDEQIGKIAAAEMAWQVDLKTPWVVERGDLIDAIHTAGKLPTEKWAAYLLNAAEFRLVARKQVRRGDVVPTRIETFADRCGSRTLVYAITQTKLEESDLILLKKWQYQYNGRDASGFSRGGRSSTGHNLEPDPKLLAPAADGTKNIHMSVQADVYDHTVGADTKEAPVGGKTVNLATTWDLVPADTVTVTKIEDATAAAAVEKSVKVNNIRLSGSKDNQYVNLSLNFTSTPVPLACEVILRSGEREWSAGHIYVGKGGNSGWGTGGQVKNFDATTVDVILRADEKTALETIDMTQYWTGEATIKNVPVTRQGQ